MARLFQSGFEWQSLASQVEFSVNGGANASIDTATKNGGNASMRISGSMAAGVFDGVAHNLTLATDVYGQYYIRIHALPSDSGATVATFDLLTSGGAANAMSIQIGNEGGTLKMHVYYNAFGGEVTNTATINTDTWYRIEFLYKSSGAGATDQIVVKVDGTTVADSGATLTLTSTPGYFQCGVYNGSASTITTEDVNFDDIALNSTSGSVNNSYPGGCKIVIAVPTGAGDNAATTGIYSYINEIPPSGTATSGSTMIELDNNPTNADYNVTDSSTMGIGSSDTIQAVSVLARIREETAGTSNYTLRLKSASGGTTTSSSSVDAGNTTPRTNPNSTTAFGNSLISETDPTTGVAWTPTGTNSIDNMQVGVGTTDGTPDTWCLALCAMVAYVPAAGSPPTPVKDMVGIGVLPFVR